MGAYGFYYSARFQSQSLSAAQPPPPYKVSNTFSETAGNMKNSEDAIGLTRRLRFSTKDR